MCIDTWNYDAIANFWTSLINTYDMKMNKLVLLIIMALLPMAVFAHAPKKVILSYDKESGNLIVSAPHSVKDVEDHFIESIAVKVNGEEVLKLEYTSQSSKESHEVKIEMPDLKSGDELEVRAACNKMGAKTGKLTIE